LLLFDPLTGEKMNEELVLRTVFYNMKYVKQYGIDPLILGLIKQNCELMDEQVTESLRDFLYYSDKKPMDLFALDIVRGREVGLVDFTTATKLLKQKKIVNSWFDITEDYELINKLETLYGKQHFSAAKHIFINVYFIFYFFVVMQRRNVA
jgi:hypothetical protein